MIINRAGVGNPISRSLPRKSEESVFPCQIGANSGVFARHLRVEIGDEFGEDGEHDVDLVDALLDRLLLRQLQTRRLKQVENLGLKALVLAPVLGKLFETVLATEAEEGISREWRGGRTWLCFASAHDDADFFGI